MWALSGWLAVALLAALDAVPALAGPCHDCLRVGAATVALAPPAGTPLAGYGSPARRLAFPDVLGLYPYAFWFKPSEGTLDPLFARAVFLEEGAERVAWATVDLIAVDRTFTREVQEQLRGAGLAPLTLIVSASHTHSGPGAFVPSALWAFLAVDRYHAEVRASLAGAVARAIVRAEAARVPARVTSFGGEAPEVTVGRLGLPVDREITGLKFAAADGPAIALVWNYAIHGTMLGPLNLKLSGDVMGVASAALERDLRVPVLFVNGAVGDVSPRRHGPTEVDKVGGALAESVRAAAAGAGPPRDGALSTRRARVALPSPFLPLRNCLGGPVPASARLPLGWLMPRDAELTAVAVSDAAWVTVPGELQSALGEEVKTEARRGFTRGFVAGLSNDYLAYFVSAAEYPRPGYVTCSSLYGPTAGATLTSTARDLLRQLAEARRRAAR